MSNVIDMAEFLEKRKAGSPGPMIDGVAGLGNIFDEIKRRRKIAEIMIEEGVATRKEIYVDTLFQMIHEFGWPLELALDIADLTYYGTGAIKPCEEEGELKDENSNE